MLVISRWQARSGLKSHEEWEVLVVLFNVGTILSMRREAPASILENEVRRLGIEHGDRVPTAIEDEVRKMGLEVICPEIPAVGAFESDHTKLIGRWLFITKEFQRNCGVYRPTYSVNQQASLR